MRAQNSHPKKVSTRTLHKLVILFFAGVLFFFLLTNDKKLTTVVETTIRTPKINDYFSSSIGAPSDDSQNTIATIPISKESMAQLVPLNPADFALTPKDYGGHPAYNAAMHARVCAQYFASRSQHDQDLADAMKLERMPENKYEDLVAETVFKIRTLEVQCRDITERDIKSIPALMREAAAAGDIKARASVLFEDFQTAEKARIEAKMMGARNNTPTTAYSAWLGTAIELAERGNQEAARIAGALTAVGTYGQQDVVASAAWMLVGLQTQGESFEPAYFPFDSEPYNTMSEAQKTIAIQRARATYTACCSIVPNQSITPLDN